MPKLLTASATETQSPLCQFTQPTQNESEGQQVPVAELKARCDRYYHYLAALQPPQENTMLRAANFTVASILEMLQESPQSNFIRVYYGIKENGEHELFMAPITADGTPDTSEEAVYADDCCACPPMSNCSNDEFLSTL
ncbi:hypothetical protein [Rufibacter quisquiliarum]|uniref:Uncharacterized protein n=1 Tax=Rufibacter quisquiliarum TaxID=1549639 RepID=A0A839GFY3_9BACT|nr:hypothetical protein [Rufibacter quisquiliarum]MBA9077450.1 hypothetical protein [Rufibacter quisquiliarum]